MPVSKRKNFPDKVMHIMGTYGLRLQPEVLASLRRHIQDTPAENRNRLAEEEAAIVLAHRLHAMVVAELPSGMDSPAMESILGSWSKFTQQSMYRSNLGLINMVLFDHEILPLIDDLERILEEESPADGSSQMEFATRRPCAAP
jgi:hypothetical protein